MNPSGSNQDDDLVVLVDQRDTPLGMAPKLDVHRDGRLHRAVSVVLCDAGGRLLIQRRAATKYHSGGLWSNTCCGHPRPGELAPDAARRRLRVEMGIEQCDLTPAAQFIYRAELADGFIEHELDHVMVGEWSGTPVPHPGEVSDWRWMSRDDLLAEVQADPGMYTVWLPYVLMNLSRGQRR
jgi:isopentenyl-diphosphate Delta-isomerase